MNFIKKSKQLHIFIFCKRIRNTKLKMKAGLLLVTLNVVAIAQAKYELACAKSELSIRWPSYESNSDYYICPRLFGKQMTVTCNPGEVFTFVFQSCTAPNKYIPAPALEVLPTASPLLHKPNKDGYLTPMEIPNQPPVLNPLNTVPSVNMPMSHPAVKPVEIPVTPEETKQVDKDAPVHAVVEEPVKPLAPLPPTPAPTPPVVEKQPNKKPSSTSGKKPAAKKKSSSSTPATIAEDVTKESSKKPSPGKKPAPKKNGKQNPKVDKSPKKLAKKPNTLDKKPSKV